MEMEMTSHALLEISCQNCAYFCHIAFLLGSQIFICSDVTPVIDTKPYDVHGSANTGTNTWDQGYHEDPTMAPVSQDDANIAAIRWTPNRTAAGSEEPAALSFPWLRLEQL